jgi:hypothetical protein
LRTEETATADPVERRSQSIEDPVDQTLLGRMQRRGFYYGAILGVAASIALAIWNAFRERPDISSVVGLIIVAPGVGFVLGLFVSCVFIVAAAFFEPGHARRARKEKKRFLRRLKLKDFRKKWDFPSDHAEPESSTDFTASAADRKQQGPPQDLSSDIRDRTHENPAT